jgi:fibronectin-binding autotransporter adhesin
VFTIKFTDNTNTKSFEHYTDSTNPQLFIPLKFADGSAIVTTVALYGSATGSSTPPNFNNLTIDTLFRIGQAPSVVAFGGVSTERFDLTKSSVLDTATGTIRFADVNATGRPTVAATFDTFTYQNAQHQDITATLTPQERLAVQAVAVPLSVNPDPGNNNNGSATWVYSMPDGAFDFLGAGETLTLTYLAHVSNNFGTSSQPILITIVGSNDVPVITSITPQAVALTDGPGITADGSHANAPTSGTLSFSDPDLTDTHTVSVELLPPATDLTPAQLQILEKVLAASIATDSTGTGSGTINWTVGDLPSQLGEFISKGKTLTLTFAVTVRDSQGATATQDVTVTITGTPDEVWIATAKPNSPPGGLWSDASNWATGTVPTASDDVSIITNPQIGLIPSYPVMIKDPAVAGSLTMNDLGTSAPQLINCSTLVVGGAFNLSADSIVYNSGTIKVGGLMEVLDNSVLQNCGILFLEQGGDFKGHSAVSNADGGLIQVCGGTLNVQVDISNFGQVAVDSGAALTLNGAAIDCGTVTNEGELKLAGGATLKNGVLGNSGQVNVSGTGNVLDHETLTNTGALEIFALGALTLGFTTIANAGGLITVDGTGVLTLNEATINGGAINNYSSSVVPGSMIAGNMDITGSSTISNAHLNYGNVTIESGQTLTLDHDTVTGTTFTFVGTGTELRIDGSSLGGSIAGLAATDEIDLQAIGFGLNTTGGYVGNASGGVLTITDGAHSISMTLVGDYLNAHFAGSSDGTGGTLITLNALDDAPVIATADKTEVVAVMERDHKIGSSLSDTISGAIHFTDIDLTDRPTATVTLQSVTWTGGTLTAAEITALEQAFSLAQSDNTNNGAIGWGYAINDDALDFLGQGQTATVTSTVTLSDHQGGTDTATVAITLHGANDAPTIVSETDPSTETVILYQSPTVLAAGVSTNSLGMPTETFSSHSAGSAWNNGFGHGNFFSEALQATFTASGDAGVVYGSSKVTAAPLIGPLPGHADTTNYLSIGAHGTETLSFATEQNEFGLYWGSADSFNTISFYDDNKLVASYSGTDVAPLLDNGIQGSFSSNGYVEFSDLAPFNKVVLASGSSNAFEIDNISSGFVSDSHVHLSAPITGTLTVSDADIGDTLTASVTADAVVEYNGSTTLPAGLNVSALIDPHAVTFASVTTTGGPDVLNWTYHPTNADLDFLKPGDTLTLAFNALVSDGNATSGSQALAVTFVGAGSAVVNGTPNNDTFINVGGGVTIFGKGGQDNFAFSKDFGSATIADFDVNKDTIDIDHTLFSNVAALLQSAHSANSGHDTIITDLAHDQITLSGVTVAELQAHNFHLV